MLILNIIGALYASLTLLGLVYLEVHAGAIVRTMLWHAVPIWALFPVFVVMFVRALPELAVDYICIALKGEDCAEQFRIGVVEGFYEQIVRINPNLQAQAMEAAAKCGVSINA